MFLIITHNIWPEVLQPVVLTACRYGIAVLSTEGVGTPHVLKCGYTHSCDLINCIFPWNSVLKLLARRKAPPVLAVCVRTGGLIHSPEILKGAKGRGHQFPC